MYIAGLLRALLTGLKEDDEGKGNDDKFGKLAPFGLRGGVCVTARASVRVF